jgi:hypothetical protein
MLRWWFGYADTGLDKLPAFEQVEALVADLLPEFQRRLAEAITEYLRYARAWARNRARNVWREEVVADALRLLQSVQEARGR